jgi:aspartyl-tRNA(Asn)/glutamyl-tRNA(Gln) amidotransferase subunit A
LTTATTQRRKYLEGEFQLQNKIEEYLKTIESQKNLNAFIRIYHDQARQRAVEIDRKLSSGKTPGKLAGTVTAVKDNICVKDQHVSCGSKMLDNFVSLYDATVIEKILAEDGLIIGKTNLDEFAMGSSTENSFYEPARHPLDMQHVAGGSSGGSAIAVAKGMADITLGSDTGGSIRQPAAFCGVVGLKPSYGRVSRYGLVAYASSLDQIGPFAKSVEDAALMLEVISGNDPHDSTSVAQPVPQYTQLLRGDVSKVKIGVPKQYFQEGLDPEIKQTIEAVIDRLKDQGISIKTVDLPLTDYATAAYYIIATAEASSNLGRYDGVRYGHRTEEAEDLQEMYVKSRSEGLGREVKRRIMLGTYVLSAGYYDAYYKKAQQVRRLIKQQYDHVLEEVDVLITPTTPTPPFELGEKLEDPLQMYLSDIYTVTVNLAGICAMNLPCGKTKSGMPIGLQLISGAFREESLLQMGHYIEKSLSYCF